MEILITGGAGYIGSQTCLSLLDSGAKVTVIDNLSTGNEKLIPRKADFVNANINETSILKKLISGKSFDALIHLAAFIKVEESIKFPKKYLKNNEKNSSILFNTCIKNNLKNFIFSSTASVYKSQNNKNIKENHQLHPVNPYGISKLNAEKNLINLHKTKNANYIILRYFNVAGADLKLRTGLITKKSTHLIKIASEAAVGKRKEITIFGNNYNTPDGTAIRDYIHVSDLADIHLNSLDYLLNKKNSTIINCGYGKGYSVKEVLDVCKKICKKKISIKYGNRRNGDAESLVSNTSKLKKILKWKPKYNNLEQILKSSIKWEKKLINEKSF